MPVELTAEQFSTLAEIEARGCVQRVQRDLVQDDPRLRADAALESRLWNAFRASRDMGIQNDRNLAAFLRVEAYAPQFHAQPATRAWLTRPGYGADQRFDDYQRVMRWRVEHPEYAEGLLNGSIYRPATASSSGGTWANIGAIWRRIVGRRDRGRNGESAR